MYVVDKHIYIVKHVCCTSISYCITEHVVTHEMLLNRICSLTEYVLVKICSFTTYTCWIKLNNITTTVGGVGYFSNERGFSVKSSLH